MKSSFSFCPEGYESGVKREWLVGNGLGGYASSTAICANTRAYHGLLVAALDPPVDRMLLLSSLDEEIDGFSLSNHQYPGAVHPQGFQHLIEFSHDPLPAFHYLAGNAELQKKVFMIHGENTAVISYRGRGQGKIRILPLAHCRSFHAASSLPKISQEPLRRGVLLRSGCRLYLLSDKARYVRKELVYYSFEYEMERRRGLPWGENLFCPGYFELNLDGQISFAIVASSWRKTMPDADEELSREEARLLGQKAPLQRLAKAADTFVVQRADKKSIIAGYHWFDDWGRDAMIALPGLLLSTGRLQDARAVLQTFAAAMCDGVVPNDLGARSYNTVDASLWFIRAVHSYWDYSGDLELVRQLWPAMLGIIKRYSSNGQDFRMDSDCLISSGPALSWMDARVEGRPVTPRAGKCCEINALWYDALEKMEALAEALREPWDTSLAEKARQSFQRFWNSETGCLFDVLDPEDASVRPNQIIAAAIFGLLPMIKRKSILEVVTRDLLTPYGLRTLSPQDPRYIGRHEGGPRQRDLAYHQGTVWPWLIGPYIDTLLSANDYSLESKEIGREMLRPLAELDMGGINTIPEVFDGDSPHQPGGCMSQAWSVAEVLFCSKKLDI